MPYLVNSDLPSLPQVSDSAIRTANLRSLKASLQSLQTNQQLNSVYKTLFTKALALLINSSTSKGLIPHVKGLNGYV